MKILILLILIPLAGFAQPDISTRIAEVLENRVPVYKEAAGITKIGELMGKDWVLVIGEGGKSSFCIYRKGITGYVPSTYLLFPSTPPSLFDGSLNDRLKKAIEEESTLDSYIETKRISEKLTSAKMNKAGIGITKPEFKEEFGFCGFEFAIVNYNPKTIKYIYLTLAAYNPVNDLVQTKRFTFVGPVQELKIGSYENKYAFSSTRAISYYRVKKLEIQYMDLTKKEFSGESLKSIVSD